MDGQGGRSKDEGRQSHVSTRPQMGGSARCTCRSQLGLDEVWTVVSEEEGTRWSRGVVLLGIDSSWVAMSRW